MHRNLRILPQCHFLPHKIRLYGRIIDHLFDPYMGLFRALLHARGGIRIDSEGLKGAGTFCKIMIE